MPRKNPRLALLDLPVSELRKLMSERRVTPSEVVEAHIARIRAVNPAINALVVDRFAAAREEARAADEQYATAAVPNELPPLLGIPFTAKEFFGVTGMPNTAGLVARKDVRATRDATPVARYRAAGAILLGLSNVPEGGLWMETHNLIYGRTKNPWNLKRTSGGSSGGEGALVATGGSAFGLGADFAGSIRTPAGFCGVYGHKPSGRVVPSTGHYPMPRGKIRAVMVSGPLTRSAGDLMPLTRIIAGPDGDDPYIDNDTLGDPDTVDVSKLRVMTLPRMGPMVIARSYLRAMHEAAALLGQGGARVSAYKDARVNKAFLYWNAIVARDGEESYAETLGEGNAIPVFRELAKAMLGKSKHTAVPLVISAAEELAAKFTKDPTALCGEAFALRDAMEAVMGDDGVMIVPPFSRPAPLHGTPIFHAWDSVLTSLFSVFEFPVTMVPVGFDSERQVPLAVQVVGARKRDHVTIAAAMALEKAGCRWRRAMA